MGWRADDAYEKAQLEAFREWKASLTWGEYVSWQWHRWRAPTSGAAAVLAIYAVAKLVFG
jgi:hypothetical protein